MGETDKEWRELSHHGGVAEFDLALFAAQEMLDAIQRDRELLSSLPLAREHAA